MVAIQQSTSRVGIAGGATAEYAAPRTFLTPFSKGRAAVADKGQRIEKVK
jgi:hypothetical protein